MTKVKTDREDHKSAIKWLPKNNTPKHDVKVLVLAKNSSYKFGHPQLLAGHFVYKYYDTVLNTFKLTGVSDSAWEVVMWCEAPNTPTVG